MIREYILRALEASNLSQRKLSLAVIEYLGRQGHDQSLINKILNVEGDVSPRTLQAIELKVIERLTQLEMETLIEMSTMGTIGHGQVIQLQQGLDRVPPPRDTTPQTTAIRIVSDEFFPVWEIESVLYFTIGGRPEAFVHRRCVIKDATSAELYLGILRPDILPDHWRIQSVHGKTPDIAGVVVEWASPIEWVKIALAE